MSEVTATVRRQLEEVITWWPVLDDVAESLLGVTGHGVSMSGIHTTATDSTTERAVIQLERIEQISIDVAGLAFEWGWQPRDGHKPRFLLARLDWAMNHMPADDTRERINSIHERVGRVTGYGPRPTTATCPVPHDQPARLLEVDDGLLRCTQCGIDRTPDELAALARWRITQADPLVARKTAARILGVDVNVIDQRIHRRQPACDTTTGKKLYVLSDLA